MQKTILLISAAFITQTTMPIFDDQAIEQALHTKTVKYHRKSRTCNFEASVKDLFWGLAEVAMYKADRFFDFHMVPPVIVKLEEEDEKQVLACYSFWIEPQPIKITGSDHLKSLISETEWTQMNIFYFLFGQYDKHFGNQIIGQDDKLYLIDNEAIANIRQFVFAYSPNKIISLPWVSQQINNTLQTINEPDDFKEVITEQQDPQIIHEAFPDLDIYAKRDIDNGYTRIWKKILWRQMYAMSTNVSASFSETINQKLLQQLYELTEEKIFSFWPVLTSNTEEAIKMDYQQRIKQFCVDTLKRRDMILAYFEQHPDRILKN